MARISVILPAFNAQSTIRDSIQSIIDQSYKDWELIVINDGSTDKTKDVVQSFADPRILFLENDGNKGLVYTLNRALLLAQGYYVARMDADDISLPTRFENQISYIIKYGLDLVGCMTARIDMEGNVIIPLSNKSYSPPTISRCLKHDNCIAHPTWFGKKQLFLELNGYRNFHACEDYDFLLRAVHHHYKIGICDSILLKYRENFNGVSNSNLFKQRLSAKFLRDNFKNIDNISEESLNYYLKINNTTSNKKKYEKGLLLFDDGINCLRQKKIIGVFKILKSVFISKYVFERLCNLIKIHSIRTIFK